MSLPPANPRPPLPGLERVAALIASLGPSTWSSSLGGFSARAPQPGDLRIAEDFADGPAFERHRVFWVESAVSGLAVPIANAGRSRGLFSYDGRALRYLHDDPLGGLASLLRGERRPMVSYEAGALARLFAEVALRQRLESADVIPEVASLRTYGGARAGEYELDERALAACAVAIAPPRFEVDHRAGYRAIDLRGRLVFVALYGRTHARMELAEHTFAVDTDGSIRHRERRLARAIFRRVPSPRD